MSKRWFQISLARWLLLVALVGAAAGLFGTYARWADLSLSHLSSAYRRWRLDRRLERSPFTFRRRSRYCEGGFLAESAWRIRKGQRDAQLLYLLVWPTRGRHVTHGGPLRDPTGPAANRGVYCGLPGLYVDGRRVPTKPGQPVWIYSAYEGNGYGSVDPVKVTQGNVAALRVKDFERLEQMPCWPEIEAALVKYSKFAARQKDQGFPPWTPNPGETPP
jgi:hypothetical protein